MTPILAFDIDTASRFIEVQRTYWHRTTTWPWVDVWRGARGAARGVGAIFGDLHAFTGLSADHGPAGLRTEIRGAHTGHAGQRLADAGTPASQQFLAGQYGGGNGRIRPAVPNDSYIEACLIY